MDPATFDISEGARTLTVSELLKVYMEPAVAAIAQRAESELLDLYAGFTVDAP